MGKFKYIRKDEVPMIVMLAFSLFILLIAYYMLKTLREPMILASSHEDEAILQSGVLPGYLSELLSLSGPSKRIAAAGFQAALLMFLVPLFGIVATKFKRLKLVAGVSGFFILCMVYFFFAMKLAFPFTGFAFFIWVGIFSVAMISIFWSYAADIYTTEQGNRLFAYIGIGASLGAPIGALLTGKIFSGGVAPEMILGLSAVFVCIFIALIAVINRNFALAPPHTGSEGARGAFSTLFSSPYLILMALLILMLNLVNTTGEYILSEYIVEYAKEQHALSPETAEKVIIADAYASFYFWVNLVALILQTFAVAFTMKHFGLVAVLFVVPVISFGVYALAFLGVGFFAMKAIKIAENSSNYSFMNTARAMLFLPTDENAKYKAKQAIDTFVVRIGDMISAFIVLFVTQSLHFGMREVAGLNVLLVAAWLAITWLVYRSYKNLLRRNSEEIQ